MDKQKKKEIVLIASMILVSLIVIIVLRFTGGGSKVVVSVNGEEWGTYDLNKNQTIEISTDFGTNVFEIKDGNVDMISATCPDKICVNTYPISEELPGVIVCLPNLVIVEIREE